MAIVPMSQIRTPAQPRSGETPAPLPDVRVGSTPPGTLTVSESSRSYAPDAFGWSAFATLAVLAFVADQTLKALVSATVELGRVVPGIGPLSLTHLRNSGIAFGLFPNQTSVIAALSLVVVAVLLVHFARAGARIPVLPVALGLVAGWTVSNLVDRVRLGYVVDYLRLPYWPSFNLADAFIVAGVGCLLVAYSRMSRY